MDINALSADLYASLQNNRFASATHRFPSNFAILQSFLTALSKFSPLAISDEMCFKTDKHSTLNRLSMELDAALIIGKKKSIELGSIF